MGKRCACVPPAPISAPNSLLRSQVWMVLAAAVTLWLSTLGACCGVFAGARKRCVAVSLPRCSALLGSLDSSICPAVRSAPIDRAGSFRHHDISARLVKSRRKTTPNATIAYHAAYIFVSILSHHCIVDHERSRTIRIFGRYLSSFCCSAPYAYLRPYSAPTYNHRFTFTQFLY